MTPPPSPPSPPAPPVPPPAPAPAVPPFTVRFHLGDGSEVLSTSGGAWSNRRVTYDADCMTVWNKSTEFMEEPGFVAAYRAGMDSGHKIGREPGSKTDLHIEWRVHVCCWAAAHARQLPGDFVECGVNTGIFSLAVCRYIDFNATGKSFYLFDTYRGIPETQITDEERALGRARENEDFYEECFEVARRNFAPFARAVLVRGVVPDTLATVEIERVCYLSIDMNVVEPERAAIEHFWDRLVPGGLVVLDDYGWLPYRPQKLAMDDFAASRGVHILTLPTGQGLLIKP